MRTATPAQDSILRSDSRIRVIRAAPGSGKTWLVAQALDKELRTWRGTHRGVAALSFTNVAGEEIRRALGSTPHHPHFVGTIDAFLYRYVVRPFARMVNPRMEVAPRLIPADAADRLHQRQYWSGDTSISYSVRRGKSTKPISGTLYDCHFVGRDAEGQPALVFAAGWDRIPLNSLEAADVLRQKKDLWRVRGRMSHSDVVYIAASILESNRGQEVLALLARRFPLLVVDELQDTGYFRSRSLLLLLQQAAVRGLLVGDPDQAIYGFSGAHPDVFREFELLPGAVCLDMRETVRCGRNVCRVASVVAESGRAIEPLFPDRADHAILLTHDGDLAPILHLASELRRRVPLAEGKVALLARKNTDVNRLLGRASRVAPPFYCPPITSLFHAVQALHHGHMAKARAAAEAAIGRIVFDTDVPSSEELERVGLARPEWKYVVAQILFAAASVKDPEENAFEWGARMLTEIEALLQDRGWLDWCEPKWPKRPRQDTQRFQRPGVSEATEREVGALAIQTVHSTKGETHHTTIYYVPRVKADQCPSRVWWPDEDEDGEERRVAFVAASRPRDTYILLVHQESFERLQRSRPTFLDAFAIHPMNSFLKGVPQNVQLPSFSGGIPGKLLPSGSS